MLIQFSVSNYLSFDEEQVFSLLATNDSQHRSHLISNVPHKGDAVLRAAAIYGANGAGKSNLIKAITFAQSLILQGTRGSQSIDLRPFKLSKEIGESSKFEFIFRTEDVVYNYGFRLSATRILEEWLFATPKTQEVLLFQRTTTDAGRVSVEFGPSFTGRKSIDRQFLEFVALGTRPNQLFLTECFERNVVNIQSIIQWFRNALVVISAESNSLHLPDAVHHSRISDSEFLSACLQTMGTGIDHVITEQIPLDLDVFTQKYPPHLRNTIVETMSVLSNNQSLHVTSDHGEAFSLTKDSHGHPVQIQLRFQHQADDGRLVTFNVDEESDGTQRLLYLLPALFLLKSQSEKVVIIDELDRRFHTLISRHFIESALNDENAQKTNQLIFTTHDTNLLDLELLRRDEIWFMEKENGGASHLYSLAEFKVRTDLKVEKGYLAGRFGAIPFASDTLTQEHVENVA